MTSCDPFQGILLFGSLLCGRVDGSCFRYYLIMATYVSKMLLETSRDFHQFATIVYPFLQVHCSYHCASYRVYGYEIWYLKTDGCRIDIESKIS